ncbi:MAG: hypothetical protein HFE68_05530, partial [Erysipelotrichaceae bacterium]|nr:hypothetical protein [Erysipelotrichaceae bacterium]
MWKKLLLLMIAFIGIITMTNAYHDARMNAATSWLSLNTLSVGDKVVVGNYGGKEVIWDIGAIGSGDYTLMMSTGLGNYPMCSDTTESAGYSSSSGKSYCNFMTTNPSYTNSPIYDATNDFQSAFSSFEKQKLTSTSFSAGSFPYAFVPRGSDFKDYLNISNILAEAAYQPDDCYWLADYGRSSDDPFDPSKNKHNLIVYGKSLTSPLTMKTRYPYDDVNAAKVDGLRLVAGVNTLGNANAGMVRLFALLKKDLISFSLPSGLSGKRDDITTIRKTRANDMSEANSLKVRFLDSDNGLVTFQSIVNEKDPNQIVTEVASGDKVKFNFQATSAKNNQYISAIFHNLKDNKRYYQKLTLASSSSYVFDTGGLPTGKYEFALVNETIEGSSQRITTASPFSSIQSLEIVEPHKLTYTKQPEAGAT